MKKLAFNIAIDGPAGAGKSTIAKMVAKKLNFIYVDTGAMYRAIALYLLRGGVDTADETAVSEAVKNADITISYQDGAQQVILNGEDVSGLIRTEKVGNTASATSVYPSVRAHLLELQRSLAASQNVIMDGRDIGTCILPDAQATGGIPLQVFPQFFINTLSDFFCYSPAGLAAHPRASSYSDQF